MENFWVYGKRMPCNSKTATLPTEFWLSWTGTGSFQGLCHLAPSLSQMEDDKAIWRPERSGISAGGTILFSRRLLSTSYPLGTGVTNMWQPLFLRSSLQSRGGLEDRWFHSSASLMGEGDIGCFERREEGHLISPGGRKQEAGGWGWSGKASWGQSSEMSLKERIGASKVKKGWRDAQLVSVPSWAVLNHPT